MAKGYILLQKKLKELEFELNKVIALPAETPCHQLLSEGIKGRFGFLKTFLSTEFKSQPQKQTHLHHIAQRLKELEAVFQDWDNFRTSPIDHLDSGSTCSCTESCLEDDGSGGTPDLGDAASCEDPESIFEDVIQEMPPEVMEREEEKSVWIEKNGVNQEKPTEVMDEVEGYVEREEEKRDRIGKNGCGVMTGVGMLAVVVMAAVMAFICDCSCYRREMEGFLTPT